MSILAIARKYTQRGWRVIPVPYQAKNPGITGWQQLRLDGSALAQHFPGTVQNIGVLLGEPSQWLLDVDLDHALAVDLAEEYIAPTGAIFGRRSKPRSHWLYYATSPVITSQWRVPVPRQVIAELRSTGSQTVFPGSAHPSGERIEWDRDGEPARIDPRVLSAQLESLYEEICERLCVVAPASVDQPASRTAPPSVVDRAAKYLAKLPPAVSGQGGHNATFYAACTLVIGFGLDRESALGLLRRWNDACQPPWSEKELGHKVDEALKQPGWRGYLLARPFRRTSGPANSAIERANRHAIEHRRRARRRA